MKSGIIWKAMKFENIFFPSMAKKCIKMEGKSTNNEKTSNTSSKYGNAGHIQLVVISLAFNFTVFKDNEQHMPKH